jgi:hypothetical protein
MASALVPLAAQSATAQAEVMGLVQQFDPAITSFSQLKAAIASSGASFSGLDSIVGGATALMANMQGVASALGNVLSSALVSAMQAAQVQASGAGAAMEKYTSDLMAGNAAAASADYSNLISDLEKLGLNAQQAAALVASVTQNLHGLNGYNAVATITVDTNYITTGSPNQISTGIPNGVRAPGHAAGTPAGRGSVRPGLSWSSSAAGKRCCLTRFPWASLTGLTTRAASAGSTTSTFTWTGARSTRPCSSDPWPRNAGQVTTG